MTNQVSLNVVLGNGSVAADSLADGAVITDKIANDSVTAAKIANGSVAADGLADGAVITDKIANGSVTADKLANGSVAADGLADGAVTTNKIANDSVTADKIADDVLQAVPVGTVLDFAGTTAPSGYLACDGAAVSRTTYGVLFSTIGTSWGEGDGSTTFNVPDLRRRVTVGAGGTRIAGPGTAVGNTGGAEEHTLATSEMPSHSHGAGTLAADSAGAHTHGYKAATNNQGAAGGNNRALPVKEQTDSAGDHTHSITGSTGNTGGGGAHNNMQPSAVVNKIIKT